MHGDMSTDQAEVMAAPLSADSSHEEEEDGELWIHWKDPYWKQFDSRTPHPKAPIPTTTTTPPVPGGGRGGGWGNDTEGALLDANGEAAKHLVVVLVLLVLSLLLTVVGNAIVCLVYRTRLRRTTANLNVVLLGGLQLGLAALGVPVEMATLALPLLFRSAMACKVCRYLQTASVCTLLLVLVAVAVDRYRTRTRASCAKWLYVAAMLVGLCLAFPSLLVFGSKRVATDMAGVTGVACGVDDAADRFGAVAVVYVALVCTTFLLTLCTLTALYVIIFLRTRGRKSGASPQTRDGASPKARDFPRKHRFVTEDSSSSFTSEETRRLPTSGWGGSGHSGGASTPRCGRGSPGMDPARAPLRPAESARIGQARGASGDVRSARATRMFFVVTIVTVLSVMPFVVLRTLEVLSHLMDDLSNVVAMVAYQVGMRLYLLHLPVIPFVYLKCNKHFRREAKLLVQRVGLPCKHPPSSQTAASGR